MIFDLMFVKKITLFEKFDLIFNLTLSIGLIFDLNKEKEKKS